jgi:hypothetical protein
MITPQRLFLAGLGAVGLLLLIIFVGDLADRRRVPSGPRTFEIEMRADAGTTAQLFWADDVPEVAKERWVEARVRWPEGPFSIVAVDATPDSWFGFREPVEIGWASPMIEWLIGSSRMLLRGAVALAVLAVRWTAP